jgi:hypothetical protein
MSHLGISEYHRVAPSLADPNSIGDCIFWADFTDKNGSVMEQTLAGSTPVTTNGQYIAIMKNKAAGTGPNFDKLGMHIRVRKDDSGNEDEWQPVYRTGGEGGMSYGEFPSTGNVCMAAGIFGNLDAGENNGNWGGCCGPSGAFSNLNFFGKEQTIIVVEKIGTNNVTSPNAMYQVRGGCNDCASPGDDRKVVINTQKVANETYNTFMGSNASGAASEVTATSSTFANTNIRCIVTSTTTVGGNASPDNGQAMIYVNGALEDTENLNTLNSTPGQPEYYGFDMSMTQAPTSSGASFAGVCVGAEMNDNYLAASSFGLNHYYGGIYEVIHFAKTLDAYELGLIESYIAEKYNITFS